MTTQTTSGGILCLSEFWHEERVFCGLRKHAAPRPVSIVNLTVAFWTSVILLGLTAPIFAVVLLFNWRDAQDYLAERPFDFDVKRKLAKYPGFWAAAFEPFFAAIGLLYYAQLRILLWWFDPSALVVWNGMGIGRSTAIFLARRAGLPVVYLEHGALPNTVAVDLRGINFHNSVPRSAEFYREFRPDYAISKSLVPRPRRTPRPGATTTTSLQSLPARYVFVPFQVYTDTQIVMFSPLVDSMYELYATLERAAELLDDPHLCFVVKEHPSCAHVYPELHDRHPRIRFANDLPTEDLIRRAACVLTINSSVGIEAILHHQRVITLGQAFYNIEGIVRSPFLSQPQIEPWLRPGELPRWLAATLNQLAEWQPDTTLMQQFVTYLKREYLAEGSMNNPTSDIYAKILALTAAPTEVSEPELART